MATWFVVFGGVVVLYRSSAVLELGVIVVHGLMVLIRAAHDRKAVELARHISS